MCRPVLGLVAYGVTETDWPRVTRPQHPQGSITVVHHKGDEAMARRLRAQATTDGDSRRAELRATVQLALPLVACGPGDGG